MDQIASCFEGSRSDSIDAGTQLSMVMMMQQQMSSQQQMQQFQSMQQLQMQQFQHSMQSQMNAMECRAKHSEKMLKKVLKDKFIKKRKKAPVESSIDISSGSEDDSSAVGSD